MRLGLLTDIHEHVEFLTIALDRFDAERVDQVVVIGDVFRLGERIEETCRLLATANAVGVWGNHDFGLCIEPVERTRARYPASVVEFMTSLRPRLDIGGCHFKHVEPWLNPE
jgi:predicted phosphodiesterase